MLSRIDACLLAASSFFWYPTNAVELSSCLDQTDRLCSRKVLQPGGLTSDLHRPDMTF